MKTFRPMLILLILTAVVILCAGCTSTSQPAAAVTTEPTATATVPTAVPTIAVCGIENCHGLTVQCGPNPATACPNDMNAGDRCRQYASCQVVSGSCQLVTESKFTKCVNCVEECQKSFINNPNQIQDCSQTC